MEDTMWVWDRSLTEKQAQTLIKRSYLELMKRLDLFINDPTLKSSEASLLFLKEHWNLSMIIGVSQARQKKKFKKVEQYSMLGLNFSLMGLPREENTLAERLLFAIEIREKLRSKQ